MLKHSKTLGVITIGFSLALIFCVFNVVITRAQTTPAELSGWAWSDTIGWISMNCTNEIDGCAQSNYKVSLDASGNLTGYAWSDNIGWIQFGGLSNFPTGGLGGDAKLDGTALTGWARALSAVTAATAPGGDNSGGWDGWISLAGANYTIPFNGQSFSGFGWGSDVVGWLTWGGTPSGGPGGDPSCPTCVGVTTNSGQFNYAIRAPSVSVDPGASVPETISLSLVSGTTENVAISFTGTPTGLTITPATNSCSPACSKNITITANSSILPGPYTITVHGLSASGLAKTATFVITVNNTTFSVFCIPYPQAVAVGKSMTWKAIPQNYKSDVTYTYTWGGSVGNVVGSNITSSVGGEGSAITSSYPSTSIGSNTASVSVSVDGVERATCNGTVTVNRPSQFSEF